MQQQQKSNQPLVTTHPYTLLSHQGYVPRQALYSCATCFEETGKVSAICLACSLECHDNHDLYELYTKRNYRCDCGNSNFKSGFECKLMDKQTKKLPSNDLNKYNHNFKGKYCICDKKYPPDESYSGPELQSEMWQCIVCEDWYHSIHLGAKKLPTKFDEMICGGCVDNLDFIRYYRRLEQDLASTTSGCEETPSVTSVPVKTNVVKSEEKKAHESNHDEVDSTSNQVKREEIDSSSHSSSDVNIPNSEERDKSDVANKSAEVRSVCESDTNDSQMENKDPISKNKMPDCLLEKFKVEISKTVPGCEDKDSIPDELKGPIFWADVSWRSKLCRCQKCIDMYKVKECEFLLDQQDTVQDYEAQGKAAAQNTPTPFERGMTALNQMNRAAVVEALHGYDELRSNLSDYLRKFATSGKIVREEDIHEFFEQLKTKKRQRLE